MTKPFSPRELVARVRALLRRVDRAAARPAGDAIRLGALEIDPATRRVTRDGERRAPHADRVRPAAPLAARPAVVYARGRLLAEVWG